MTRVKILRDATLRRYDVNVPEMGRPRRRTGAQTTNPTKECLMAVSKPTPTSVYRYYDQAGLLLYIGVTSRGTQRNQEHNATKEWWRFVKRQNVDHYPTREAAEDRERALIKRYRPPFNKQHNPGWEETSAAYLTYRATRKTFNTERLMVAPSNSRILLDAWNVGPSTVMLRSDKRDAWLADSLGLDTKGICLTTGVKRKGSWVQKVTREDGVLDLWVHVPRAPKVEFASLMVRGAHGNAPLTVKRIDLVLPGAELPLGIRSAS